MPPTVKRPRKPVSRTGSPTADGEKSPAGSGIISSASKREQPPLKKQKIDFPASGSRMKSTPLSEIRDNAMSIISRSRGKLRWKMPKMKSASKTPKSISERMRENFLYELDTNTKTPSSVEPFEKSPPETPSGAFTTPQDRCRLECEAASGDGIVMDVDPSERTPAPGSTPFSNFASPQSDTSSLPSLIRLKGFEPSYSPFPAGATASPDVPPSTPRMTPGAGNDGVEPMSGVKCLGTPVASATPCSSSVAQINNDEKRILAGLTIYAEIKFFNMDKSQCVRDVVESLGAKVVKTFAKSTNLVVFKEGKMSTYLRAKRENIPLVSVPWVSACRQSGCMIDPAQFPPSTDDEYKSEMFNAEMARRERFLKRGRLFLDRMDGLVPPGKPKGGNKAATVGKKQPKLPKRPSGDGKPQKKLDFEPPAPSPTGDPDEQAPRRNSAPADLAMDAWEGTAVDGVAALRTPPKNAPGSSRSKNRRKLFNPNDTLAFSPTNVTTPADASPYWKESPLRRSRSRTTSSKRPRRLDGSAGKRTAPRGPRKSLVPLMEQDEDGNHSRNSLTCFDLGRRGGHLTRPQPRICFTSLRSQELDRYTNIVEELGSFEIDKCVTKRTTHLLSSVPPRRTVNLLRAIARGCWILDIDWLTFCKENDKWMSEEPFELKYFSEAVAKNRLERQAFGKNYSADIFASCGRIFVGSNVQPPQSDIVELLKLCKASVAAESSSSDIIVTDRPVGEDLRYSRTPIVSPLWVLDSITHNKLCDVDRYKLT